MMHFELFTEEQLKEIIDNTRGFVDYVLTKRRLEFEQNTFGAYSWLFDSGFVFPPPDLGDPSLLTGTELYIIETEVEKALRSAFYTPKEFRNKELKMIVGGKQ